MVGNAGGGGVGEGFDRLWVDWLTDSGWYAGPGVCTCHGDKLVP